MLTNGGRVWHYVIWFHCALRHDLAPIFDRRSRDISHNQASSTTILTFLFSISINKIHTFKVVISLVKLHYYTTPS